MPISLAHAGERWSARSILRGAELRDAYPAASLLNLNLARLYARLGDAGAERSMLRQAEAGSLDRIRALPGTTPAAIAERASYRALVTRYVRAAWLLANPDEGR
ncbi:MULTISPECIES: hypothetical protein [unclassified Sphingomonas]|uniref:hypothetical protein n=1 Tax=unclassified Sphingomonas TaxID=196159 RepID=UPI002151A86C|nr:MULTISPECIES: hypothetical protein [unclassified Sphingomonas]MCR5870819.1 hypothetical protein [Sphingomonas sp. J344]UUY00851.1 hypothetical protein LRS08_07230 [Sphingomonas sp. J315]